MSEFPFSDDPPQDPIFDLSSFTQNISSDSQEKSEAIKNSAEPINKNVENKSEVIPSDSAQPQKIIGSYPSADDAHPQPVGCQGGALFLSNILDHSNLRYTQIAFPYIQNHSSFNLYL